MRKQSISKRLICIIVTICLLGSIVYTAVDNSGIFNKRYDTIENAIFNNHSMKTEKIVGVLEDNGCALVLCKYKNEIRNEYVNRNEKGWAVISKQVGASKIVKYEDDYAFVYRKFVNKNIFEVRGTHTKKPLLISDTINSNFKYFQLDEGIKDTNWFLVLDELPKDYAITINGEKIKIN